MASARLAMNMDILACIEVFLCPNSAAVERDFVRIARRISAPSSLPSHRLSDPLLRKTVFRANPTLTADHFCGGLSPGIRILNPGPLRVPAIARPQSVRRPKNLAGSRAASRAVFMK
jgi:hypothetical protein